MKNINNKNMAYSSVMAAILLGLAACGSSGSGSSSAGSGGGGTTACTDISGEPDIMGAITYSPASAKAGDTVTMHVPVDADTAYVTGALTGFSGGSVVGAGTFPDTTVASPGVQTLDITVTISPGSGAGDYFLTANICSVSLNACKKMNGAAGVAVSYASNPTATDIPMTRFKYFANGSEIRQSVSNLPVNACINQPVLTITP